MKNATESSEKTQNKPTSEKINNIYIFDLNSTVSNVQIFTNQIAAAV